MRGATGRRGRRAAVSAVQRSKVGSLESESEPQFPHLRSGDKSLNAPRATYPTFQSGAWCALDIQTVPAVVVRVGMETVRKLDDTFVCLGSRFPKTPQGGREAWCPAVDRSLTIQHSRWPLEMAMAIRRFSCARG